MRKKLLGIIMLCACLAGILYLNTGSRVISIPDEKKEGSVMVNVYFNDEYIIKSVDLEEYLIGVVASEMPPLFEPEALRAQAVAARTYIIKKMITGGSEQDMGAAVCNDPAHCKGYIDDERAKMLYGEKWEDEYRGRIKTAVDSTRAEIMTYEDEPITATFFAMSGGRTENSADVWGQDLPYLHSVDSAVDAEAPGFETSVEVSLGEFKDKILKFDPDADFNKSAFENIERSGGGAVLCVTCFGVRIKGTQMRSIFSLRSANFEMSRSEDSVTFTVRGYGHGVGMSQWGANLLAKQGMNYVEILKTYYEGIEISNYTKTQEKINS